MPEKRERTIRTQVINRGLEAALKGAHIDERSENESLFRMIASRISRQRRLLLEVGLEGALNELSKDVGADPIDNKNELIELMQHDDVAHHMLLRRGEEDFLNDFTAALGSEDAAKHSLERARNGLDWIIKEYKERSYRNLHTFLVKNGSNPEFVRDLIRDIIQDGNKFRREKARAAAAER
ncbi:MAG: hypothetical protein JW834_02090 [Candidatus Diapherotrites archaeon]|nr:hypothetical protein [Candidatus Diapherotrites archaeon]